MKSLLTSHFALLGLPRSARRGCTSEFLRGVLGKPCRRFLGYMRDNAVEFSLGAIIVALLASLLVGAVKESTQWELYKVQHNCQMFSKIAPTTATALSSDGKVAAVVVAGKTGYRCDDGTEHWR